MKTLFLVAILVFSGNIFAQPERDNLGKRVPPASAILACEGKVDQTVCTMKGRNDEEMTGVCENTPDGKYFACKPNRKDDRRRPPRT